MEKTLKIILCEECGGIGSIDKMELECYHNGKYSHELQKCSECKGTGRLVRTVETQTTEEPFEGVTNVNSPLIKQY